MMRGVAAEYGHDFDDATRNFATLSYNMPSAGCTGTYHPPATTAEGVGIVSRHFDFTTGTIDGRVPGPNEAPVCSRPYIVEMYPDEGYASTCRTTPIRAGACGATRCSPTASDRT